MIKRGEIGKLTLEQLETEEQRLRRHLFDLRAQAVTEKLENPKQLTHTRRDIARVLTELHRRRTKKDA